MILDMIQKRECVPDIMSLCRCVHQILVMVVTCRINIDILGSIFASTNENSITSK